MAKHGWDECSSGKVSKSRDKKGASIDRISSLPDELLVLILSSLPFKEAVASSILSRRWRYLWTFINKLDFDGTSSMLKLVGERLLLLDYKGRRSYEARVDFEVRFSKRRLDYIEWVNHVIASNKSPDIEEFRVFFDLTKYNKNSIDEWLRFALTRKVQRLELNLTAEASNRGCLSDCYTFDPYNLLKGSFSHLIDHFKYLKRLFLNHVNLNDEALEFLLFNSPMLEHLSLSTSIYFRTLRIIGPFTSFKRLEIDSCYNLESVEIRDVNLVYVKYIGSRIDFVVENVPLLVEMYIEGWIKHIQENLLQFSNYLPQLEILTISCISIKQMTEDMCSALKMRNLKQLIVKARIHDDDHSLIPLTNLVNASPCLQRFVLEATHVMPLFIESNARKIVRSYPQLKQIEFVGYRGVMSEQELLTHLLDNAVALEKIVIDTRSSNRWWNYLEKLYFDTREKRFTVVEAVRAMKLLQGKVPPTINLKILI